MHLLSTGWLKSKRHGEDLTYSITMLDERHLPAVMNLQNVIIQNLQRKDLLQPFTYDFMKQHMGPQGIVLGVFVQGQLVAFRNVYFPDRRDEEWNLGIDLNLPKGELDKVANLQMVCVHPDYRGNRLALKMNAVSLGLLRERGRHYHVCATVSPYNIWNLRTLLNSGFRLAKLKDKYGGLLRYIVHQNLRHPMVFDPNGAVEVRLSDLESQKKLFFAGLSGVSLNRWETASVEMLPELYRVTFKRLSVDHLIPYAIPMDHEYGQNPMAAMAGAR